MAQPYVNLLPTFIATTGIGARRVNLVMIRCSRLRTQSKRDYMGFLTHNSELRRCWCPSPGRCFISVFLYTSLLGLFAIELDIDIRQATKSVSAVEEALIDIFKRIKNFFKHVETYADVPPTAAMMDIIVNIMLEE
jgi:hypothetical protein